MSIASLLRGSPGHIRSRMFRDLVLSVIFTAGLLVLVNWLLIGELKREVAGSRIETATALVRDEVRNLLGPVTQQLLIVRDGLRSSGLRPSDREELDDRFRPVMSHLDQIAGIILADEEGAELFLFRENGRWLMRERGPGDDATSAWTGWSQDGEESRAPGRDLDYDPRQRPWFIAAINALGNERPAWSEPYVFHALQVPGVTVSVAWEQDGSTRVLAMDVVLRRILDTLDKLPLGGEGRSFLFRDKGGIYVASGEDPEASRRSGSHFFSARESLGGPLPFEAVHAWEAEGRPAEDPIRFRSQRRDWWGGFMPLSDDPGGAWVGVALPVSATLGVLQDRWWILALAALIILASGAGLVLLLMRKYSSQLRDLPKLAIDHASFVQDIQDLIRSGEDTHLELKSTMRTNLHTGKSGKEIELAWLKGAAAFLNTEGGILLLGVADDGSLVGLEEDRFENEDRCRLHFKNLLNQHLGAENARFLCFDIYQLEGKQIGAVECERSDQPVFLHHKNAEAFLIRNGPSNIELSVSRAVKYIQGRF